MNDTVPLAYNTALGHFWVEETEGGGKCYYDALKGSDHVKALFPGKKKMTHHIVRKFVYTAITKEPERFLEIYDKHIISDLNHAAAGNVIKKRQEIPAEEAVTLDGFKKWAKKR